MRQPSIQHPGRWPLRIRRFGFALAMSFVCALALARENSSTNVPPARVWPAPPDAPRVVYVQSIAQPADTGQKQSGFHRFANWVSGARKGNEKFSRPFGIALDETGGLCLT